jgi:hypothetical protein
MNCKPPDLAYIVYTNGLPENIGRVVEVIEPYGEFRDLGFCWYVRSATPMAGLNPYTGERLQVTDGFVPDSWLRPISGVPVDDEVTDEVQA